MTQHADADDIEETLTQVRLDSLRRLAEQLLNELDEVREAREATQPKPAG